MRHAEKYLHEGESVLIPRKGTLNNVMLVNGRFWTVDTMFYTKELMEGAARYAYFILSKMDLASMNAGSAVPSMTTKILSAIPVVLPPEALLAEMKTWSDPLFEQIRLNERENEKLSALRDALLPKLMSGKIDVSQIELPTQLNNHLPKTLFQRRGLMPGKALGAETKQFLAKLLRSRKLTHDVSSHRLNSSSPNVRRRVMTYGVATGASVSPSQSK